MITLRLDKNGGINKGDVQAFEHDNKSEVYIIQLYKNGAIYDLTNKTVELTMVERKRKIGDMVSLPVYEATEGKVKLEVTSDITKQDGIYDFKLTVKDTTGLIETFPNFQVKIENDITDSITGEIIQDPNFTILTDGLKALADYNIYKTNALKVPEIEQDIVEINEQLDTITQEVEKPITLNKCDSEMLEAIQNKEGETTFNLLSIPRDNSVNFQKLDTSISKTLYETSKHDDRSVIKKGVVGNNDLYFINKEYNDCVISNITIKFTQPGAGEIRIYENDNDVLTLVKTVEFDTNVLSSLEPTFQLNYKVNKGYIGLTKNSGTVDFGTIGTYGMLTFSPKTNETFKVSEGNIFNQYSLPVMVETFKSDIVKKHELSNYIAKDEITKYTGQVFVVVDKNGNGNYTSIQEALDNYNGIPIFVRNGVYNEGRLECDDKEVTVYGENKYKTIIINNNGLYGNDCLYASNGYFENLQFKAEYISGESTEIGQQNGAYAVHVDSNNQIDGNIVFDNCIMISDFNAPFGNGLRGNNTVELNNCDLISRQENRGQEYANGGMGALFTHNNHTGTGDNCKGQLLRLNNCRLKAKLKNVIKIQEISKTNSEAVLEINNCLLYSETNGITDVIKYGNVSSFDEMSVWKLSETSYGNSVQELNNF